MSGESLLVRIERCRTHSAELTIAEEMFLSVYENHLEFRKPHPPHWQRGLLEIENRLMQLENETERSEP